MNRLTGRDLTIAYGSKVIIENLNMEIPDKKITSIIGPNGCGKSTLLKALCRLLPIKKGKIALDGADINKSASKEIAKKIAILPQSPEVANGVTVGELVSYGRYPYQKGFGRLAPEDVEVIEWALQATDITEFKHSVINDLSGGQKQRVWIAMALAQKTDIIFLDEPTTFLDIAHQLEILELIKELNQKQHTTIVMVLHDINQAIRFSDYMITMKDGEIITQGNLPEVLSSQLLAKVFHIDAELMEDKLTGKPMIANYQLVNRKYSKVEIK
ncbi:ABC transporter ATP-binding protein [Oceanobacillus jeddahense]|uniref:ABC transporter ATP-binding protein n=1 Tax=Oceanobacillus jeddahense TaxID=1462527 RepID=UPI000595D44B|nr:ABC transporter ATP-binding protein [Oceanobacillus jeddahense]